MLIMEDGSWQLVLAVAEAWAHANAWKSWLRNDASLLLNPFPTFWQHRQTLQATRYDNNGELEVDVQKDVGRKQRRRVKKLNLFGKAT